jgi:uncharacterized Rossmann fold enzyme
LELLEETRHADLRGRVRARKEALAPGTRSHAPPACASGPRLNRSSRRTDAKTGRVPALDGVAEIDWEWEEARSGEPTLRLGGRQVHSRYDPRQEAEGLAERAAALIGRRRAQLWVLVGRGLGYFPEALAKRVETPGLVWDPFPETSARLPLRWTRDARVEVVHTAAAFEAALRQRVAATAPVHVEVHPGYEKIACFEARFVAWLLRRRLPNPVRLSAEDAVVSPRALEALARLPQRRSVGELGRALAGHSALVVAPGPSLEAALPALRERRGGVVIAAVQALRRLAEAGVRVDAGIVTDPRDYSEYLEAPHPPELLFADSSAHPSVVDRWPERTVLFHIRTHQLHQVAWEDAEGECLDEPFVTVSEAAVVLARQLGAERLFLLGVDLAHDEGRYAVRMRSRDALGRVVWTNATYLHAARYLGWLCPRLAAQGFEIRRPSEGLAIPGTLPVEPTALGEALASEAPFAWPPAPPLPSRRRLRSAVRALEAAARSDGPPASARRLDSSIEELRPLVREERRAACQAARDRLGSTA